VAGDHLLGGIHVFIFLPALGQHEFLVGLQHREFADIPQIPGQIVFRR